MIRHGHHQRVRQSANAQRNAPEASTAAEPQPTPLGKTLSVAMQHHQAGRLSEAETLYRWILEIQPAHCDALHLLGLAAYQRGEHDTAANLIGQAVSLNPRDPIFRNNFGLVLRAQGRLAEAIASLRLAVCIKPDYSEAYSNLG